MVHETVSMVVVRRIHSIMAYEISAAYIPMYVCIGRWFLRIAAIRPKQCVGQRPKRGTYTDRVRFCLFLHAKYAVYTCVDAAIYLIVDSAYWSPSNFTVGRAREKRTYVIIIQNIYNTSIVFGAKSAEIDRRP